MSITSIRLGTRKSPLALAQAEAVRIALLAANPGIKVELVPMSTTGDAQPTGAFGQWGFKGLFTKELEEALLDKRIDAAVHSMKDMPSVLPEGLVISAYLPREDARDAFVSLKYASFDDLPQGATFGTSSVRRMAQVKRLRPDLKLVELRGNVQTRLSKLEQGVADATLLAVAGLKRLGLEKHITKPMEIAQMLPAVAQGAIGVECRAEDAAFFASINDTPTRIRVECERGFLAALDGSCSTPLAGYAEIEGHYVHLRADVVARDGSEAIGSEIRGPHADAALLGNELGKSLKLRAAHLLE